MPSSTTETMRASGSNPRLTIITGTCKCTFISIPIFLSFPLSLALSLSLFLIFLYCIYYLSFIATFSSSFLTFTFLCSRDVFIIFYFISIAPYWISFDFLPIYFQFIFNWLPFFVLSLEFGKALIAKCGAIVAVVEDVIHHSTLPLPQAPQPSTFTRLVTHHSILSSLCATLNFILLKMNFIIKNMTIMTIILFMYFLYHYAA